MMINAAHQMAINYSMRKRDRGREREKSSLPATGYSLPACHLPLIVAEWNYSITLLNWIPRIWQGQTRSLLIALKALITVNCFHNIFRQPGKLLHLPHSTIEPYLHATCHMPHAWRRPCLTLPPFAAGFGISILLRRVTKYLRTLDVSSTLSSIPKPGILAHNIKRQPEERERQRERGSQGSPLKIQLKFSWTKAPAARSRLGWAIN